MTIYLIRHGLTAANETHLYCGSTDLPLSEAGKDQLRALRYSCPGAEFVTSGMERTEQTLAILFGPVPHRRDPRFREVDFGVFEMRGYEQLKGDGDYQAWISGDNEKNVPPGGESGEEMTARGLSAFGELARGEKDVVLITHGGVIAAIMAARFPEEGKNRYQWQPKPGHGYALTGGTYRPIPE